LGSIPAYSSPGDDLSIVNPLHWLGADSIERQTKLAAKAKRNADLAEKEAKRLELHAGTLSAQAIKARAHAEKARAAAKTLEDSLVDKKEREAQWDNANKPQAAPVVKEPSQESTAKLNLTPHSAQDKQEIGYLPESNANAPNSMDAQSQSDAHSRMLSPDKLKDTLPGTRSDDIVRQEEKSNKSEKGKADSSQSSDQLKTQDPAAKGNSPWNPIGWFNGGSHAANRAKAPETEKAKDSSTAPASDPGNVVPTNLPPSALPNSESTPQVDARQKPAKGKRPALKAPQLMFKSHRKNDVKTEHATDIAGEAIATSAIATEASKVENTQTASPLEPASKQVDPESIQKARAAILETEKGSISIELFPKDAPETVKNFAALAEEGFYNRGNMKFHRVIPGFVIQTGDPTGTGAGGSKNTIPLEAKNKLTHNVKGVVAMARGGDPDSASSQFYITLAPQTALDGKYAIFGKVVGGLDVIEKITKGDELYAVRIVEPKELTHDPVTKKNMFSALKPGHKQDDKHQ
jgi:cyclophilin family peptidyl-prolyl cis-trans isomerase